MIDTTLRRYSHKVGLNFWHLEWCTKYRYKMMKKLKHKNLVTASILKVAKKHNIKVHVLAVMPDHVHMLVSLPKNMTDSRALALLKGGSSYLIFKNNEKFSLRYPKRHFWSAGSCAVTVGYNDLDSMTDYIMNQETHHEVAFA